MRAVDVLGSADVIAAEDTRVTGVLLRHYGIATRPMSLHEHNEAARAAQIVGILRAGRSVALVSDAGTPAISDPGARLVRAVRDGRVRRGADSRRLRRDRRGVRGRAQCASVALPGLPSAGGEGAARAPARGRARALRRS